MKRLSCFFLVFVAFTNVASGDEHVLALPNLIEKINVATNSRWMIRYDHRFKLLTIESKAQVKGWWSGDNSSLFGSSDSMRISFKVVPRILPEIYSKAYLKRKGQFEITRKNAEANLKPTESRRFDYYEFKPQSKTDWNTYMTYVMARESFEDLPEYYFGRIGLSVYSTYTVFPWDSNDKVSKRLDEDWDLILGLLKKYKLPK